MLLVNLTMLMALIGIAITMIFLLHTVMKVIYALDDLNRRTDLLLYFKELDIKESKDDGEIHTR